MGRLVEALIKCVTHISAAGNTYVETDAEAMSTPNLLRGLSKTPEFHLVHLLGLLV